MWRIKVNINELVLKEDLTEKQREFLETHSSILTSGSVIANGLISLAQNLKKMRDEKLFLEAGFETFEDYSEKACNLKQRQAYNYIKILDSFGEEFLHSNAKIGVAKLTLLSSLSEEEKVEVLTKVDVENVSVSELKERVRDLKLELSEKDDLLTSSKDKYEKKLAKMKTEIDSLKNKPVEKEVVASPELQEKIDALNRLVSEHEKTIKLKDKNLEELSKKQQILNSEELVEFKYLFAELQSIVLKLKKLMELVPEDKKSGCIMALKKVGEQLC